MKIKDGLVEEMKSIKKILDTDIDLSNSNLTKEQIKEYKTIQLSAFVP